MLADAPRQVLAVADALETAHLVVAKLAASDHSAHRPRRRAIVSRSCNCSLAGTVNSLFYVVSGNRAFVVWRVDIDHAEWGTINTTQVAIQEWKDGRIVREKFVYW